VSSVLIIIIVVVVTTTERGRRKEKGNEQRCFKEGEENVRDLISRS
jgi:hypothetical protein